jgi:hypothetical protein
MTTIITTPTSNHIHSINANATLMLPIDEKLIYDQVPIGASTTHIQKEWDGAAYAVGSTHMTKVCFI